MRCALTFLLAMAGAAAQKVYSTSDPGVIPPRLIRSAGAEYSEEARLARLEGTAVVSFIVQEDATLRDIYVSHPLGLGLDGKAIDAVKQWRFSPGTRNGQPVAVLMKAEVNFKMLTTRWDWHLTRAEFDTPKGAAAPHALEPEFPPPVERNGFANSLISFDIDEQGSTANPHLETVSDDKYARELIAAVRGWKFQPAVLDGKAIRVRVTFGFTAGLAPAPSNIPGAAVRPG